MINQKKHHTLGFLELITIWQSLHLFSHRWSFAANSSFFFPEKSKFNNSLVDAFRLLWWIRDRHQSEEPPYLELPRINYNLAAPVFYSHTLVRLIYNLDFHDKFSFSSNLSNLWAFSCSFLLCLSFSSTFSPMSPCACNMTCFFSKRKNKWPSQST